MKHQAWYGGALALIAAAVAYHDFQETTAAEKVSVSQPVQNTPQQVTPGIVVRNDGSAMRDTAQPGASLAGAEQQVTIMDKHGFEQSLPAFRVNLPARWQAQGEVVWKLGGCMATNPSVSWQARSPDGAQVIEILPRWASQQRSSQMAAPVYQGCPDAALTGIRDYLHQLARERYPDAQVIHYRDRPDLAASVNVVQMPDLSGSGIRHRAWAEGGEIVIGWQQQGQTMREAIILNGHVTEMQVTMPMVGMQQVRAFETGGPMVLRTSGDQLDLALLDRVRNSIRMDPQWQARVSQGMQAIAEDNARTQLEISRINAKGAQDALREQQKRGQIIANTQAEIAEMQNQTWQSNQATDQRIHEHTMDTVRGVQPYYDPVRGSAVEVDNSYQYLWRLEDGSYFQTNDPSFNPSLSLGVNGEQLHTIQR